MDTHGARSASGDEGSGRFELPGPVASEAVREPAASTCSPTRTSCTPATPCTWATASLPLPRLDACLLSHLHGDPWDPAEAALPRTLPTGPWRAGSEVGLLLTFDAEQGVRALRLVRPKRAIPIHDDDYTVFRSSLDEFLAAVRREPLESDVRVLRRGESYHFDVAAPEREEIRAAPGSP